MNAAYNEPTKGSLGHLQGNVNRLRMLFSSSDTREQGPSPTQQLRHGRLRDHSPSPFQAARVSLQNIEEDLNSIHGLLSAPPDSRDGVGRAYRSVSPATMKLPSIREPSVSSHEAKSPVPLRVVARASGRVRSNSTPLSKQHSYERPGDARPWIHSMAQSSPGPCPGGSPQKIAPPNPAEHSPPSGHNCQRHLLPFYNDKENSTEKCVNPVDSSYSIRVDFGMSIRDSLHRPKDASSSNSLSHAIDTLLMVTGNDGMSAQNVEEHVMEQTRMMWGQDQLSDPFLGAPDVQCSGEVVRSLPLEKPPPISSIQPDLVLSASTVGSSGDQDGGSSGSSTSTVRASPHRDLGDREGSNTSHANGSLSYRPPSVRSLPASYLAATSSTCHCPYCCSCGSYQKRFDTFPSHRMGLHQRSPSIQSVPVYLEGASPDILHARRSRNCPLQCFGYPSSQPSPTRSTISHRFLDECQSSHTSVEELPQLRSSVKELAQSFEKLAIEAQGLAGSDLSLSSMSNANGVAETQHVRLRHTSDHRRSPSLASIAIPEESLSGPACRHPLHSAAVSTATPGGSGNLLQMSDVSRESLTSLSSQRTNISMDPLCCIGQNLRVGVDGKVFRDRMEVRPSLSTKPPLYFDCFCIVSPN